MTGTCRRLSNVAGYGRPTADSGQLKRDGLPTTNRLSAMTTEKACLVKEHSTKPSILACHALPPLQSRRRSSFRSVVDTTTQKYETLNNNVKCLMRATQDRVHMLSPHTSQDGTDSRLQYTSCPRRATINRKAPAVVCRGLIVIDCV